MCVSSSYFIEKAFNKKEFADAKIQGKCLNVRKETRVTEEEMKGREAEGKLPRELMHEHPYRKYYIVVLTVNCTTTNSSVS